MSQVEIGFRAILGDEDFSMLKGAHRTWIDVDVRIQFHHGNLESASLEDGA